MPGCSLAGGEGEFGVAALVFILLEIQLQQAAVIQARVASVSPLPAGLQLGDETVVDGVAAVGDVQQDVDLLHVLHQAPGDGGVGSAGLGWSVDHPGVDISGGDGGGGGQGQEVDNLCEETEEEEHVDVDQYKSQDRVGSQLAGRV